MTDRKFVARLLVAMFTALLIMAGLVVRLVYLHSGSRADQIEGIHRLRRLEKSLTVGRGKILDAGGHILALDLVRQEVRADPAAILREESLDQVSTALADLLELDREDLRERLNQPARRDVTLLGFGRVVGNRQAERLRDLHLPGVFMREMMVRSYPRGAGLCHVLGFVNLERHGSAGIEQRFDRYLRGVPGLLVSELDGRRRELYDRRMLEIRPRPGADVVLTIDQYVQYLVEQALARAVVEYDALAAWAIVQRVQTGEILAMAGYPGFDGNDFRGTDAEIRRNRCISYNFEPGSTFKMAVIAAALDAGVVHPEQVYDCEDGVWIHHRRPLRDYSPHGLLTVADIIKKSSNIGAAKIALELGAGRLYRYMREFGVGQSMGIDLPGEEQGILHPTSRWSALSISRIAMGHEVAMTALQVLGMMNAIANEGVLMKPLIVREVRADDGQLLWHAEREVLGRPVRPETAALMLKLLARVTEDDGTGRRAQVAGYTVAGKTGTAQKVVDGVYSERLNISSFVGVLPAEHPRLGIIVVLDEPKAARTGGAAAAPVFSEIAEQAVRYLDIAPVEQLPARTAYAVKMAAARRRPGKEMEGL